MVRDCLNFSLCITNKFLDLQLQHNVILQHPRYNHWHQLDILMTSRKKLSILLMHSYHSADCDNNHSLVCHSIKLKPGMIHQTRKGGKTHLDSRNTAYPELVQLFTDALEKKTFLSPQDVSEKYTQEQLRYIIHSTALEISGKKQGKRNDWFNTYSIRMISVTEVKGTCLANYKQKPCQSTLIILICARRKVQQNNQMLCK